MEAARMENYNQLPLPTSQGYVQGYVPGLTNEGYQNMYFAQENMPLPYNPPYGFNEQEQDAVHVPSNIPDMQPVQQQNPQIVEQVKPSKPKRRSKHDNIGRDYRCGCGKTYLSYPALYTHIKTKHDGQNPIGTQLSRGKGRGGNRKKVSAY